MERFGPTIRQIRLNKGFTHKEIYIGIVSKSYAIDFEKGLYDIKFSLMLKILDRLMISVEELLLIHNHYQRLPFHEALPNVNLTRLKNDPHYTSEIETYFQKEGLSDKTTSGKLLHAEIVALQFAYTTSDYQTRPEYLAAKNYIQQYLFDAETWTLSEIRIFSDMSFLFENSEIKTSLFLTAWDSLEHYKIHPDYPVYLSHLLINNLFALICTRQYSLAKKALVRLQDLTDSPHMLSWKVPMIYYEGLLDYATGDRKTGLIKIQKAKEIYRLCGHKLMEDQMEIGLKVVQSL